MFTAWKSQQIQVWYKYKYEVYKYEQVQVDNLHNS